MISVGRCVVTCSSRLLKRHLQAEHTILSDTPLTRLDSLCLSSSEDLSSSSGAEGRKHRASMFQTYRQIKKVTVLQIHVIHTMRGWDWVCSLIHLPQSGESLFIWAQIKDRAVVCTRGHFHCLLHDLLRL